MRTVMWTTMWAVRTKTPGRKLAKMIAVIFVCFKKHHDPLCTLVSSTMDTTAVFFVRIVVVNDWI